MIDSFYVSNYKCLVDVRVPLTPIHVIIGQNDSGKTSLLEAIFALSRSRDNPLAEAFSGEWDNRELVFAGEEKPAIQFEARFGSANGDVHSPITYHLEVEFVNGRSCRAIDEWSTNSGNVRIREARKAGLALLAVTISNRAQSGTTATELPNRSGPRASIVSTRG